MIKDLGQGIRDYKEAWQFMHRHNLSKYLLVPVIVILSVFIVFLAFAILITPVVTAAFFSWVSLGNETWWEVSIRWVLRISFFTGLLFTFYYTYRAVTMIILGPYLSGLSEKVESILTGNEKKKLPLKAEMAYFFRGTYLNIRNLGLELLFTLLFFLVSFIPVIGWVASPIGIFVVQWYFIGFGYMDFSYERYDMGIRSSVRYTRKNKWYAIGNGAGYYLITLVPVVGFLVGPSLGVIAATIGLHRRGLIHPKLPEQMMVS